MVDRWHRRVARALLAILLLVIAGCGHWERADEFVNGLRCGMSEADIRSYASRFPETEIKQRQFEGHPPLVAVHGDTTIELWTGANGLQAAQIYWLDGRPTSVSKKPRVELCTTP